MFLPAALLAATPLMLAAADRVPTFDLKPTCGGAASTMDGTRGSDICLNSEKAARDDLVKQWAQFPAADRTRCVQLASMTQMPSYVQVLTCLEMARESRQLETPQRTTGTGAAPQR